MGVAVGRLRLRGAERPSGRIGAKALPHETSLARILGRDVPAALDADAVAALEAFVAGPLLPTRRAPPAAELTESSRPGKAASPSRQAAASSAAPMSPVKSE